MTDVFVCAYGSNNGSYEFGGQDLAGVAVAEEQALNRRDGLADALAPKAAAAK